MDRVNAAVFEFGDFHLDTAERVLRRNGAVVSLTPKAVSMLELLVRHDGAVISRAELIEELWPNTFVEEANLTVTISMLRKALGENYIRTIPKRGYAFAVPVRRVESQPGNGHHAEAVIDPPVSQTAKTRAPLPARWLPLLLMLAVLSVTLGVAVLLLRARRSIQAVDPKPFSALTLTRLSDTGNIRDVSLSPDGKQLAFVPIEGGREGLKLRNLDNNQQVQLLEAKERLCWGLRFAHDGQSLYYHTTEPNSTISVLYRVATSGTEPPSKIAVNVDSQISLSPDGSQIAFVRSFPGKHYDALIVANNDGTGEYELATLQHPQKFSFSGSAWSPDGKEIAVGVSTDNGITFELNSVSLSDGKLRGLSAEQWHGLRGLAWSDNGRNLIFNAGTAEAPATQLWRLDNANGKVERITNDLNYYEGVHLSKDGSRIVTMQGAQIINLFVVEPSVSAAARKLTFGAKEGEGGVVALANGQVVYTVEENGKLNLWLVSPGGGNAAQLTYDGASFPSVVAGGRYIVYSSVRTGVRHLYRLDLENRTESQLTDGGGENFPSVSPDGRWVVYTALAGARNTLWRVALAGGPAQQLTQGSIVVKPVISPDGKSIACTFRRDEADKWKIAILPFAGGEPLQVLNMPKPFNQILRWTSDSKALFYLVEKDGTTNIWKQPLDGAAPQQVTRFTEDSIFTYDRLGAGDNFVAARGRTMRDIVLISNP